MAPQTPPRAAIRMGFLGLAPLLACGFVALAPQHEAARVGALGFAIYAAVLLSFLGGVRCGFELMRAPDGPNGWRLVLSALPALAGWALALFIVLIPRAVGAGAAFSGLFAAQYVWDYRSAEAGAPGWYPLLRQVLTGGVMLSCLLIPLASYMQRI
jgi:Protein of unknown function (DUF3429)